MYDYGDRFDEEIADGFDNKIDDVIFYSNSKWWAPMWLLITGMMVAAGVLSYFLMPGDFIEIILFEIFSLFVLGGAFLIRFKPSRMNNKVIYFLFGVSPIGAGFVAVYIFIFGGTIFGVPKSDFGPIGSWMQMGITLAFLMIGGFIGKWIGKKQNYRIPLSVR